MNNLSTEKNAQRENCELSFIWGKMRTIDWETASQIVLRNCSKEVEEERSIYIWFWWRGIRAIRHTFWQKVAASHEEQMSLLVVLVLFWIWEDTRNWAHKIFSWKYLTIWRPVVPVFPRAQSASFLISTLNSFQGMLRVSDCSGLWLHPCRGRWWAVFSWHTKD